MSSSDKTTLALDLGTSTLAGRLLCPDGEILAETQVANPQRQLGADILSRLQQAHDGSGEGLQELLIDGLRNLINKLLEEARCGHAEVSAAVAAGNPGLICLLRKLPVAGLLFPPYKPPCKELSPIPADQIDLGLAISLEIFPLISGFIGGDLVAALLGVEALQSFNPSAIVPGTLLIDIGTNAELALWDGGRWWVTSAAAGPAFEGGNISAGMILADGAVTNVRLMDDRLQLVVAGGGQPCGLCGSGLAALIAVARQSGLIDETGRILASGEVETNLSRYLVEKNDSPTIRFHHSAAGELLLTQEDVRHFQLARGAVLAGVRVLLEKCDFAEEQVQQVLVTGALGTALPIETLKRVALLPEPMLDKTSFVANGVLTGLQAYLTTAGGPQRLADLLTRIRPFPLSGNPAFERHFLAALAL